MRRVRDVTLLFSGGIEKEELALKVLPYLDPSNIFVDDEPYPLASNCMIQFVLRFIFLSAALVATHAALGASTFVNVGLFVSDNRSKYHTVRRPSKSSRSPSVTSEYASTSAPKCASCSEFC